MKVSGVSPRERESTAMTSVSICEGWEGRTVDGKFPLLEWLGGSADRGVFLTVRQGIQTASIKLILAAGPDADVHLAQWEAAKALCHPSLVQVMETGRYVIDEKEFVYVVTERAEAVLSGIIPRRALEPGKAKTIFGSVADALAYVHEKGFVHGHVRPSNILLVSDEWKLSGEGLFPAGAGPTQMWKPDIYDSPEAATGRFIAASDVWSLGVTVAEALAQQAPQWDSSATGDPVVPESLPQPFFDIVRKSLRSDPSQRCTIVEIKALVGRETAPSVPEPPPLVRTEPNHAEAGPSRIAKEPLPAAQKRSPAPVKPVQIVERWSSSAADSTEHVSYPFGKVEPVEPARTSGLFSDVEEEEEESRIRVAPIVFGIIVLLAAVGGFLVMHGYRINLSRPAETQTAPPVNQPAPQKQVPEGEGQSAPTTGNAAASETQAAPGESPGTPPTGEAERPATQVAPQTQAPAVSTGPPQAAKAGKVDEEPEHGAQRPQPANAEGAVLTRVLPNVSRGASSSMRGPVQVEVQVSVNEEGSVLNANYVSHGPGNYFARISREAARLWKFRPPEREGHARPSTWMLRFHFERAKTEASATEIR
jgi:hypothetical protein